MPHYGVLRDYKFEDVDDVRGAEVYGVNDEKLGKIQDVIFDHSSGEIRYVVVDTGGWLSSKKFLVPITRIQPYGHHDDKYYAELDKERIQMLPEFNDETLKSETDWADYEKKYEEHWTTSGDVMRNEDTGRIITPPMSEVPGGNRQSLSEEAKRSLGRDFTPEKAGKRDELWGVAPSGDDVTLRPKKASIGGREDVLRQQESVQNRTVNAGTTDHSLEGSRIPDAPGLQEPGVYRLDAVPEAEKKSDMNEPLNAHYGRRWIGFQQRLRQGRDKVVSDCPLCGTQKKVA
jgi:uncharacterized protein YrrD